MTIEKTTSRPAAVERGARQRIVTAGVKAFATRGYHATTTRDIARIAKLSPAALYVHFASKEDLLFEIMDNGHRSLLAAMTEAERGEASVRGRFLAVVKAFVYFYAVAFTPSYIADKEISALRPARRRQIMALRSQIEDVVSNAIDAGVSSGEFAVASSRRACFFILSAGVGVAQWFDPKGALSAEQLADECAEMALRLVSAPN